MVWRTMRLALRIGFGVACLGLGVVGLFLPFLQGVLLIVIGLAVLSRDSPHAQRLLTWLRARFGKGAARATADVREGVDDGR